MHFYVPVYADQPHHIVSQQVAAHISLSVVNLTFSPSFSRSLSLLLVLKVLVHKYTNVAMLLTYGPRFPGNYPPSRIPAVLSRVLLRAFSESFHGPHSDTASRLNVKVDVVDHSSPVRILNTTQQQSVRWFGRLVVEGRRLSIWIRVNRLRLCTCCVQASIGSARPCNPWRWRRT